MKRFLGYFKDRFTKKEISTFAGVALMLAGPLFGASAEHLETAKALMAAFGIIDPNLGAGIISAVGAGLVAVKEKK